MPQFPYHNQMMSQWVARYLRCHFEWATQVTMSKPGSSWLPMPVTETVLPVLSKILTSEPARPPLAPLSNKRPIMGGRMCRHMIDVCFIDRVRGGRGIHEVLKGGVIKGEGFTWLSVVQIRGCR